MCDLNFRNAVVIAAEGDRETGDDGSAGRLLVVHTDGACRGNGTPRAVSGCGVWFGSDADPRNVSLVLPVPPHSNQRAELFAVLLAMQTVLAENGRGDKCAKGGEEGGEEGGKEGKQRGEVGTAEKRNQGTGRVLRIVSDSKYCVLGITSWMAGWHANGWQRRADTRSKAASRNKSGGIAEWTVRKATSNEATPLLPVANLDLWKRVWSCTRELEASGTRLELVWTKGHASDVGNNAADRLASAAIR